MQKLDPVEMYNNYTPLISIWVCRICSVVIAYAYDGYGGAIVLTWLLLSFIVPLEKFVSFNDVYYFWFFVLAFFYEYFLNIQGLFVQVGGKDASGFDDVHMPGIFEDVPRYKAYQVGNEQVVIATPLQPVEVCGFVLNIVFMFVLSAYRKDLNMSRG